MELPSETIPLNIDNLIMRGSSLKNTEFIYGIVVFTGHDTKVMKNQEKAWYKFSHLEKQMNTFIMLILAT
jgi:magnesium-transporting ATPase (P-type)